MAVPVLAPVAAVQVPGAVAVQAPAPVAVVAPRPATGAVAVPAGSVVLGSNTPVSISAPVTVRTDVSQDNRQGVVVEGRRRL